MTRSLCRLLLLAPLLGLLAPAAQAQTTTFAYTGDNQTFVVPAGVTSIRIVAGSAPGGGEGLMHNAGLPGSTVSATVAVVPGEKLTVVVGGPGKPSTGLSWANSGGFNGGGAGGSSGSGATDVRRANSAASTGDYLKTRNALVVAGGAGGMLNGSMSGSGGLPNGYDAQNNPGSGATQQAAGRGSGPAGIDNRGGSGSNLQGGGGGGYYGGGAGSNKAAKPGDVISYRSGGGGSSWVMPGAANVSYTVGSSNGGSVSITVLPH